MGKGREQCLVQALIAQSADERFGEAASTFCGSDCSSESFLFYFD